LPWPKPQWFDQRYEFGQGEGISLSFLNACRGATEPWLNASTHIVR
jgi:hypothetical protein